MVKGLELVEELEAAGVRLLIVATGTPKFAQQMTDSLGFDLPGRLVLDPQKNTHAVLGLKSSVSSSLLTPFFKHIPTFGVGAVLEASHHNITLVVTPSHICQALRVSLLNADLKGGHGSSWQQGGTFALRHNYAGGDVTCEYEWREDYPGHWPGVVTVLAAMGISTHTEARPIQPLAHHLILQLDVGAGGPQGAVGVCD